MKLVSIHLFPDLMDITCSCVLFRLLGKYCSTQDYKYQDFIFKECHTLHKLGYDGENHQQVKSELQDKPLILDFCTSLLGKKDSAESPLLKGSVRLLSCFNCGHLVLLWGLSMLLSPLYRERAPEIEAN